MFEGDSMNPKQISRIVIRGFKSIRECDLELGDLNVIIGANGAGKSNFISFFRMIQQMLEQKLQLFVTQQGGPDSILHFGRKTTRETSFKLFFGANVYSAVLHPTQDNRLTFEQEKLALPNQWQDASGHAESHFNVLAKTGGGLYSDFTVMRNWQVYHFHDTGETALVKQMHGLNVNDYLRPDGRNLAAFLYLLREKYNDHYQRIVKTIRLVAPFFDDFALRPNPNNENMIELEWRHKGEDVPFKAFMLSDGTLRFICLATVLLQPEKLQPETIIIDEPELGLHPFAVGIFAGMARSVSKNRQIILATQSPDLVNEFAPENIVVADRQDNATSFKRLDVAKLEGWLKEYSLGELWTKNLFGGGPD